jgi:hypothetical protein
VYLLVIVAAVFVTCVSSLYSPFLSLVRSYFCRVFCIVNFVGEHYMMEGLDEFCSASVGTRPFSRPQRSDRFSGSLYCLRPARD